MKHIVQTPGDLQNPKAQGGGNTADQGKEGNRIHHGTDGTVAALP